MGRHGLHRIALVQRDSTVLAVPERSAPLPMFVPELPPEDVKRWVERHLPVVPIGDERFAELSRRLGSDLALWRELEHQYAKQPARSIVDLADRLIQTNADRQPPTAAASVTREPVRVAVAGEHLIGRQEQLANAIARIASRYGIAARFDTPDPPRPVEPFGLLDVPGAFTGTRRVSEVIAWLSAAIEKGARMILADVGTASETQPQPD